MFSLRQNSFLTGSTERIHHKCAVQHTRGNDLSHLFRSYTLFWLKDRPVSQGGITSYTKANQPDTWHSRVQDVSTDAFRQVRTRLEQFHVDESPPAILFDGEH